jgi:MFS family permease
MASKQQEFVASPEAKDVESPSRTSSPNPPPEPRSRTRIVLLMSSLSLVVFLAALDQSIIATALPVIAEDLEASSTTYAWVASSYFVGVASSMPIWGRVSDIFGRKGSILMANGIFMVGSLVCALAPSLTVLIAGRAIQGE